MTNPVFRPHGSAHVECANGILTVHMRGDWNEEMRAQTATQMVQHIPALNAEGPWGIINILHDTLVFSESMYIQTRQSYAERSPQSLLTAVAFVIAAHVEGAALFKPRFETLLEGVIPAKVFPDNESAQRWMREQLGQV